jgi:rhodanese-related sulfurtransferase
MIIVQVLEESGGEKMTLFTILNIILYALLAWFLYTRLVPARGLKNLTPNDFADQLKQNENKVLIDVREPREFKTGYIPGAVNWPLSELKGHLDEISKDQKVFLYCRSGMRSQQAARMLSRKGYKSLYNLQGGILAWDGKVTKCN